MNADITFKSYTQLNSNIREYLFRSIQYYVEHEQLDEDEEDFETFVEGFLYDATNNWEENKHFNFYKFWVMFTDFDEIHTDRSLIFTKLIKLINETYVDMIDDSAILDWRKYCDEYILNNYAYLYVSNLMQEDGDGVIKVLKRIADKYRVEKKRLDELPVDPAHDYDCVVCLQTKNTTREVQHYGWGGVKGTYHQKKLRCFRCRSGVWCEPCDDKIRNENFMVQCPCCRYVQGDFPCKECEQVDGIYIHEEHEGLCEDCYGRKYNLNEPDHEQPQDQDSDDEDSDDEQTTIEYIQESGCEECLTHYNANEEYCECGFKFNP